MKAYQLKITLVGSKPPIWRRIIIPADVTFRRLHDAIQIAMGWLDYHLFEFAIPQAKLTVTNDEEACDDYKYYTAQLKGQQLKAQDNLLCGLARMLTETKRADRVKIDRFLEEYKTIRYVYDFGDYWEHKVVLEKVLEDYNYGYPVCLKGAGACPPEDVGGIDCYRDFLEAWNDPEYPGHAEVVEWGQSQHYQNFDLDEVNRILKCSLKLKKVT